MTDRQPFIELESVTKRYIQGEIETQVLHAVTLNIDQGEFVAIIGASGSGKTTLMNIIGCMDRPTGGRYRILGREVGDLDADELAALRRDTFGFIFQRYNLLGNLSAIENAELPGLYAGIQSSARRERAGSLLMRLGLGDRTANRPGQLSGGQQQRVSIARALMNGGRVILADEPTGALDSQSGREVMALLHDLHAEGHTVILITHDMAIAEEADRLVRITDGRIIEDTGVGSRGALPDIAAPAPGQGSEPMALILDITTSIKTALRALKVNRVRTMLTLLGVMIGVGSVVAMLAFGNGARQQVLSQIEALGTDLLLIRPGAPGVRGAGASTTTLVAADAAAIARLPNVAYAVPQAETPATVRYGNVSYTTTLNATAPEFIAANQWPLSEGSFFTEEAVRSFAPVAVLGQTTSKALFPDGSNPVGRYILIGNTPLRVTGVLTSKGADQAGNDRDDTVIVPLTTGQARVTGQSYLKTITVKVADSGQIGATQSAIRSLLRDRHNREDFNVRSMTALLESQAETQQSLTLMLGAVAIISLLVGGIGVMNIMLVSVTERTREIGVRMAVGARRFHILLQFLIEALVVCSIGGVIGVSLGLLVALAGALSGASVVVTLPPIVLAFGSAVLTGLVFGYLPATRAAGLDPVVALNAE